MSEREPGLDLELAMLTLRNQAKPHWICKDVRGDLWEYISYPYVEGENVAVKIRVPGDPTSMITADALLLDPEGKECMCAEAGKDFYLTPEYYRERHARLAECPARLWKRLGPANTSTRACWTERCLFCGEIFRDIVAAQEHVMGVHGYTQDDIRKNTKRSDGEGFIFTMPDGRDWMHAARDESYK